MNGSLPFAALRVCQIHTVPVTVRTATPGRHRVFTGSRVLREGRRRYGYSSGNGRERSGRCVVRVIGRQSERGSIKGDRDVIQNRVEGIGYGYPVRRDSRDIAAVLYDERIGHLSVLNDG